ncbi:hypothetical protein CI1B_59020 [Bradyrhizobium ivorense]|uniref:Pentapeptide MXKDX repeat protein n=2 Tax=Bradyrhizobium ivorense TaxID=2511166 RepID=A0A508TLX5_9BRAD|nr:hypothetical protein CI41S_40390 [Bradyrhizobium ivorense]VIO75397.1 hypothetical protein CI1B_59020 [Bradyrhizobium ivorense]
MGKEMLMNKLVVVAALALMCGPAFAQDTGPAPQTGMERPENINGATPKGSMDTTGMNVNRANKPDAKDTTKGNAARKDNPRK